MSAKKQIHGIYPSVFFGLFLNTKGLLLFSHLSTLTQSNASIITHLIILYNFYCNDRFDYSLYIYDLFISNAEFNLDAYKILLFLFLFFFFERDNKHKPWFRKTCISREFFVKSMRPITTTTKKFLSTSGLSQ